MTSEVSIGGHLYRIGTMLPIPQFHVARKIGPALLGVARSVFQVEGTAAAHGGATLADILAPPHRPETPDAPTQQNSAVGEGGDGAPQLSQSERLVYMLGVASTIAGPLVDALAAMDNKDVEEIIQNCLSVCSRQEGGRWAPVLAPNGALMYQDLKLPFMLKLVVEVVKDNLGDFFEALSGAA